MGKVYFPPIVSLWNFFGYPSSNQGYLFGLPKNYFGPRVPRLRIGRLERIVEEVSL